LLLKNVLLGTANVVLIKIDSVVPAIPENAPKIIYKVPISVE